MNIQLPHDDSIERTLLSACLNGQAAADYILSETGAEDYFNTSHQILFSVLKPLHAQGKPLDLALIVNSLKGANKLKDLPIDEIMSIASYASPSIYYEAYVEDLKNLTCLRRVIYASNNALVDASKSGAKGEKVIAEVQERLVNALGNTNNSVKNLRTDVLSEFSRGMDFESHLHWMINQRRSGKPPYEGISSGYPILDETLGFFRDGAIYYIGARTSMGKTTFILNLMQKMKDTSIGFFSLEMSASIIAAKLLCIAADIKYSHYEDGILRPEKVDRLKEVIKTINPNIFIEDPGSITIAQLCARAKRMKSQFGIKILFIDYLTRIKSNANTKNKHLEVDEISKALQSLAKDLNIPIVCLAQLNRQSAKNSADGSRPSLTDFRESGSIEEDADACILLHRPEYYIQPGQVNDKAGKIEIIIAKNRLRGILKKIDFACNWIESDRYNECLSIEEEMRNARNEELIEDAHKSILGV